MIISYIYYHFLYYYIHYITKITDLYGISSNDLKKLGIYSRSIMYTHHQLLL
jgi:hypothetical protein